MAEPTLVGANITFHTNDEDKDADTLVFISVQEGTTVAAQIQDRFQHFNDHSDAGPFDLLVPARQQAAVEKGKNELTEIFPCVPVETGIS